MVIKLVNRQLFQGKFKKDLINWINFACGWTYFAKNRMPIRVNGIQIQY